MFDREAMSGSGVVPSTLIDIAPILRVADDVETDNPFVAYLCRFSALEKAHYQDSKSSGPGVRLFKSALLRRLERNLTSNVSAHDHNQTASLLFITFEVLKESLQNKDIVFVDEIVNYAPDVASQLYDIVKKIQTSAHYKTLDLAMLSYPKILEPPREIVENRERDAPSETLQLEVLDSHEQAMLSSLEVRSSKIA
ncbi:hypothetical protein OSB04_016638 [Centaurea solstitialis]|uniref:Vta1/callose synthase N-terminal domain-containing protein n=1 Tax=Centaurea solstitialis TaxID=347529 RepID=A0AA38TLC7_9ASTR|nr:hypothetical protein OSB04_016638 [Centaurea solstitialis]